MRIVVKAKVKSRTEGVQAVNGADNRPGYVVQVKAPAADGKANAAISLQLAKYFKVRQSAVRLVTGRTSRNKVFDIDLDDI